MKMEGKLFHFTVLLLVSAAVAFETEENFDDFHEGDIRLSHSQRLSLELLGDPTAKLPFARGITSDPQKLWSTHVVPYNITPDLEAIPQAKEAIASAIKEWEQSSCLKFVRRTTEADFIEFFIGSGCWSYVGRQGGMQQVSLKDGCWATGTVVHEIGHAMGFWHEQSRPDRDDFVEIVWENIPEKRRHNFRKYNRTKIDSLGIEYDYISIMHYSATAFGGGNVTIRSKDPSVVQLGQRVGLSPHDVKQADLLYSCNGVTTQTADRPTHPPPHDGPDDCSFDSDTCGWTNVVGEDDDFDWTQRLGYTPSRNTGPLVDHTTGRFGYYMYIEATRRTPGNIAILDSKVFPAGGQRCFHFYYHMFGEHMGSVSLVRNRGPASQSLWSRSGDQGNLWHLASVQLPASTSPYKLSFVGVRGSGYKGDAAIDDVFFKDGLCNQREGRSVK